MRKIKLKEAKMNLIKRKNDWLFDPFKEFDGLLGPVFSGFFGAEHPPFSGAWAPAVDVHDAGDKLIVKADLPGLDKKNIQVAVNGDLLTIKGEKKKSDKVKEGDYYRAERYYGSFQRNIRLAHKVDTRKVRAAFKDGVLELLLPKSEPSGEKRINIE